MLLLISSVEEFILEQENKNTTQTNERDVSCLERFLKTKDEDKKIEDIPVVEQSMNTLANSSFPSALKMAASMSRLRFEV